MIHLNKNSKFSVVAFTDDEFVPGMKVAIEFFVNVKSDKGGLQPLDIKVTGTVQPDRTVVVVLAFGSRGSQESPWASYCGVQLPQHLTPRQGEHLSLELVCVVRKALRSHAEAVDDEEAAEWLGQFHVQLTSCWFDAVFTHSWSLFASNAREELPDFLPFRLVYRLMQARWNSAARQFNLSKRCTDREARGKEIEGDAEEFDDHGDDNFPALTRKHIEEMLRLTLSNFQQWKSKEFPPQLISRHTFCSDGRASIDKMASLWNIFETVIELVGRSHFVRQLFSSGQLYFCTPNDSIELSMATLALLRGSGVHQTDAEAAAPLLHFFRISRSLSSAPGLVLEMIELQDGVPCKVQPSPYVTIDQIVAAEGHVYQAFASLESVHRAKLRALNPSFRLCPAASSHEAQLPLSMSGRQLRSDIVSAADLLNARIKQNDKMSSDLWWSSPTKPSASFEAVRIASQSI